MANEIKLNCVQTFCVLILCIYNDYIFIIYHVHIVFMNAIFSRHHFSAISSAVILNYRIAICVWVLGMDFEFPRNRTKNSTAWHGFSEGVGIHIMPLIDWTIYWRNRFLPAYKYVSSFVICQITQYSPQIGVINWI